MKINKKLIGIIAVIVVLVIYFALPGGDSGSQSAELSQQTTVEEQQPEVSSQQIAAAEEESETGSPEIAAEEDEEAEADTAGLSPDTSAGTDFVLFADGEGPYFRNSKLLNEHYEKHGIDMGFAAAEDYQEAARVVVANPDSLYKTEAEDGDDVYYLEATNEFVIVSVDGYIRTYFNPSSGKAYFDRQ